MGSSNICGEIAAVFGWGALRKLVRFFNVHTPEEAQCVPGCVIIEETKFGQ